MAATPRPIPKSVRHSPPWFGALILVLLIGGVAMITVNYLAHLPGLAHGSPWGLVIGLVMIFAGFLVATRYRLASRPAQRFGRRRRRASGSAQPLDDGGVGQPAALAHGEQPVAAVRCARAR